MGGGNQAGFQRQSNMSPRSFYAQKPKECRLPALVGEDWRKARPLMLLHSPIKGRIVRPGQHRSKEVSCSRIVV